MKINKYDEDIGLFLFIIGIVLVYVLLLYSIEYLRYDQDCLDTEYINITANDYTLLKIYSSKENFTHTFYFEDLLNDENVTNINNVAFIIYPNNTNQSFRIEKEYNQTMTGKEHNQSFYKSNCRRF